MASLDFESDASGARFLLREDGWSARLSVSRLVQAVKTADLHYAGLIQTSSLRVGLGRYAMSEAAASLQDAIDWLSARGLLTFVNSDPTTVDLAPELLS